MLGEFVFSLGSLHSCGLSVSLEIKSFHPAGKLLKQEGKLLKHSFRKFLKLTRFTKCLHVTGKTKKLRVLLRRLDPICKENSETNKASKTPGPDQLPERTRNQPSCLKDV